MTWVMDGPDQARPWPIRNVNNLSIHLLNGPSVSQNQTGKRLTWQTGGLTAPDRPRGGGWTPRQAAMAWAAGVYGCIHHHPSAPFAAVSLLDWHLQFSTISLAHHLGTHQLLSCVKPHPHISHTLPTHFRRAHIRTPTLSHTFPLRPHMLTPHTSHLRLDSTPHLLHVLTPSASKPRSKPPIQPFSSNNNN